ncbi:MAG TPA: bifunctional tetrahydrofolate synthase/dihydrofolate synthase [Gammaproteobacteria bacterium]|nr:bifunctional tetrahydrofolate synthase/dihydrofolate synthase [Gammaproteobacteria bacterium]
MTKKRSLREWLDYQQLIHPAEIKLGLDRLREVWLQLHPGQFKPLIISVAGTNGKGSSVAYLDAILRAASWRVGSYTSPHLIRYNERIHINGEEVSDDDLCAAFERIEECRGETLLTYFEFGTLAALDLFSRHQLDVVILEVGLGGRLDAVNLMDADAALVTSVGIDHQAWLGDNRDDIGAEKAGILRAGKPAVYAETDMPAGFLQAATAIGSTLYHAGDDYHYMMEQDAWSWQSGEMLRHALPIPSMRGHYQMQNAAGVLMILHLLRQQLPVSQEAIRQGLMQAKLPGRFQVIAGEPLIILDVAHNQEAAAALAANLGAMLLPGKLRAIFSMYVDKPLQAVVSTLDSAVDEWRIYPLDDERGFSGEELRAVVGQAAVHAEVISHDSLQDAFQAAKQASATGDAILVFGSFRVVGEALEMMML